MIQQNEGLHVAQTSMVKKNHLNHLVQANIWYFWKDTTLDKHKLAVVLKKSPIFCRRFEIRHSLGY